MSETTVTQQDLNQQRRLAVQHRLDGGTLVKAAELSGLSNPTIIAAHKAYLKGGWAAVDVNPRGRQRGEGQLDQALQAQLKGALLDLPAEKFRPDTYLWHHSTATQWLLEQGQRLNNRSTVRYLESWGIEGSRLKQAMTNAADTSATPDPAFANFMAHARREALPVFWCDVKVLGQHTLFLACSSRRKLSWHAHRGKISADACTDFLERVLAHAGGRVALVLKGIDVKRSTQILQWFETHADHTCVIVPGEQPLVLGLTQKRSSVATSVSPTKIPTSSSTPALKSTNPSNTRKTAAVSSASPIPLTSDAKNMAARIDPPVTHLQRLEAESIHVMREVMAEAENPVMMYSIGKDSAVMLHLALKAFYPAPPPFPLLHVDTTWKFRAMYEFRDQMAKDLGFELLTHTNPDGIAQGVNPFTHGSALHTDIMKTEALKQALNKYNFDVAFGGARRDEEKSRAKERVFSFRTSQHRWEPKSQRPELWNLYNTRKKPDESIRVFPISNWTELDIWQYIHMENIPIVPLYLAAERPVVERDGSLIMVDDERMPLQDGEVPMMRNVRFRTLGCYPLTGAVESTATTLPPLIQEMLLTKTSERQGRMIDHDSAASMEKKKQEGYF